MSTATEGYRLTTTGQLRTNRGADRLTGRKAAQHQTGEVCQNGSHQLTYPALSGDRPTRDTFPPGQTVPFLTAPITDGNPGISGNWDGVRHPSGRAGR